MYPIEYSESTSSQSTAVLYLMCKDQLVYLCYVQADLNMTGHVTDTDFGHTTLLTDDSLSLLVVVVLVVVKFSRFLRAFLIGVLKIGRILGLI